MITILINFGLGLAALASIAAWLNTEKILRDLTEIKTKLGSNENTKPSIFDKDLDRN